MGGAQLLALFGMLLVFTYWFGVVGFVAFPDKFQFRRAEVVDGSTVQNSVEAGAFKTYYMLDSNAGPCIDSSAKI